MCRSIKTLRNMDHSPTETEVREAALQYVRKISGYRQPSRTNTEAFNGALDEVAAATQKLLDLLKSHAV